MYAESRGQEAKKPKVHKARSGWTGDRTEHARSTKPSETPSDAVCSAYKYPARRPWTSACSAQMESKDSLAPTTPCVGPAPRRRPDAARCPGSPF